MNRNEPAFKNYIEFIIKNKHSRDLKIYGESLAHKNPKLDSRKTFTKLNPEFDSNISNKLIGSNTESLTKFNKKLLPNGNLTGKSEFSSKSYDGKLKSTDQNSSSILWMYRSERGWTPFSGSNNIYIESMYKSKIKTIVIYPYQIDFANFIQTNLLTGTERRIMRTNKNSFSLNKNWGGRDLVMIDPLLNLLSFNTSEILRNIFNFLNFDNNEPKHTNLKKTNRKVPAKNIVGGHLDVKQFIIPRLPIENCKENILSDSTKKTVPPANLSLSPPGGYMTRSSTNYGLNVKNKGKCRINTYSRVVQSDAVSASIDANNNDEKYEGNGHSDNSINFNGQDLEGKDEKLSCFCPEIKLNDEIKKPKIYFHDIIGSNISVNGAKGSFDSSSSSSTVSNNAVGILGETNKDDGEKATLKSSNGSKGLFFFTPHKYRKSVGIIVPKILSCRLNNKKTTKSSEKEVNKYVRFNCGLIPSDQSKHSLGGYISTPRRTNSSSSKEIRSNKKIHSKDLEKNINKIPKTSIIDDSHNLSPPDNSVTNPIQTDDLKAFSVKSAFIILNEDAIPFDISDNSKPVSIFDGGREIGVVGDEGTGYLNTLNSWSRIGRMQSEFFETMSEGEFISRKTSMDINDFGSDEAASDSDARFLLDEDSRKLISLGNFDNSTGSPRKINWWFNHSVRHITVKLNCENSNFNKKTASLEIIPLLKPLLTGYMDEQTTMMSKIATDVQISGISSHVLLGLKSLEIISLRPNKSEFPKISEFCFTELNNIIPISLEELYIVQSIIPISIFSLLLTRFPVPAASTFSFSLICNDDELPNTGLQTIQVINLHLSQNPCSYIKRRNRYGMLKGKKHLTYSGDSACSHVHLDIFRKYNHVKICPWLAISNFVDEFVLRAPILVKCIIDPHNIMVVPSINTKNICDDSRSLYENRDPQGNYGTNNIRELSRGAEFVIMTANLILPLLIIQSHSIQNIIIGGEVEDDQLDPLFSKTVKKLRVDSIVFSCKYLPFKFFKVRNLDLFLDFNIDKTELGIFIRNSNSKDGTKSLYCEQLPGEQDQTQNQDCDNYCFQQLYNSIDFWIDEFSAWLDKYVCCDSIEILRINLYVTSRYLELKVNNNNVNNNNSNNSTYKDNNVYYGIYDDHLNNQKCKHRSHHEQTNPETVCLSNENFTSFVREGEVGVIDHVTVDPRNIFDFDPFYQKFLAKTKVNHNSLNDVKIKICISSHLQNFIFDAINLD
ncbi:WWE domain-containing protein [Cryptosporidium ubiquitum]|uniref:WWE domain-containing protein n=1 Tax=Cryptosporidium ubiquitum TaxID=857276 RepID=A0A1J4MFP0_9CRYT|nr:WWE domain-containing protein [Cryptosporidium ubiquitum]OII72283.1 WWE domain-containing protein [Cryptosporidium ubiquitum]